MAPTSSAAQRPTPRRSRMYAVARLLGGAIFCYLGVLIVLLFLENRL